MALSNWLTRGEWNASFISYFTRVDFSGRDPDALLYPIDLSTHLRGGICILNQHGYKEWAGIRVPDEKDPDSIYKEEDSKYGVRACTAEEDNSACLLEIMDGSFNVLVRAQETLLWLGEHPEVDFPALRSTCEMLLEDDEVQEDESPA